MNEKSLLDVYYYIDVTDNVEFIESSLRLQLTRNCKNYNVDKFVNCNKSTVLPNDKNGDDIIKSGLLTFNKMFETLKLKSTNETWFFYISSGNIKNIYRDVFVVLLNKNPREQKCFYVINKNKIAHSTICEVLTCEKTITYTNLT